MFSENVKSSVNIIVHSSSSLIRYFSIKNRNSVCIHQSCAAVQLCSTFNYLDSDQLLQLIFPGCWGYIFHAWAGRVVENTNLSCLGRECVPALWQAFPSFQGPDWKILKRRLHGLWGWSKVMTKWMVEKVSQVIEIADHLFPLSVTSSRNADEMK